MLIKQPGGGMDAVKALILLNLIVGAAGTYWNWSETGETFDIRVDTLYGLRIPKVLLSEIPVCNQSCKALQRSSLATFYSNTGGRYWIKQKYWNTDAFYCDWEGVLCYNRTLHVIAINLQGNNGMEGFVGSTLGQLPYLLGVDMGGGRLKGDVTELLKSFKNFSIRFDFANNYIYGTFPPDISTAWPNLGKIQISGNKAITGKIPEDIGLLRDLQALSLGETGISGSIPNSIARLSNLYFLDLETLSLKGRLSYLKGLSKLEYIHLMSNKIEGQIPADFGHWFPKLFELILQDNSLKGGLPSSLGSLRNLTLLQLSGNRQLSGRIPISFSNLTSLEIFDISHTQIEGFEAGLVLQSTKLYSFVAKHNRKFSVPISNLVRALGPSDKSLIQLDVQDCEIYGRFDETNDDSNLVNGIFRFSNLAVLNLGGNKNLNGSIPDPIGSLGLIVVLNTSYTAMSGALPVSYLIKLKLLQEIDIRKNPMMTGNVDDKYMLVDDTEMIRENDHDNFKCPSVRLKHNDCLVRMDSAYYGKRYCQCNPGSYGQGGSCRSCLEGGVCNGLIQARLIANDTGGGYNKTFVAVTMKPERGYWPFPSMKNVSKLVKCHWTLPGKEVGLVVCYVMENSTKLVTRCTSDAHVCAEGSYGRLCSRCKHGYYSTGQYCRKCLDEKRHSSVVMLAVLPVVMIVILVLSTWLYARNQRAFAALFAILEAVTVFVLALLGIVPSWLADVNILIFLLTIGGFAKSGKGLLKTAVFYVQIVNALVSSTHIWPPALYSLSGLVSSVVNLRLFALSCSLPKIFTPIGNLILLMLLPLCLCVLLATASFLFRVVARDKLPEMFEQFKQKCAHLSILFLNLSYFPLVRATFSVLVPCKKVEGVVYMPHYVWIDCANDDYKLMSFLAMACVVVYVIGVPALFLFLLHWHRNHVIEGHRPTQKWLGSLFNSYKPDYRIFMEFLLMLRRTSLAALLAFFVENTATKTVLISTVFLIYLVLETHIKPFGTANDNNGAFGFGMENIIEVAMLLVLLFSFIAVQSLIQTNGGDLNILWAVIVTNAIFTAVLVVCFVKRLCQREENYQPIDDGQSGGGVTEEVANE